MSQRQIRVNELLKREISMILHTRYQQASTAITVVEVEVAPNLRTANVYFSVVGDESVVQDAEHFFTRHHAEIRQHVGKTVTLKFLPHLHFQYDPSQQRGSGINAILDELGLEGMPPRNPAPQADTEPENEE